MSECWCKKAMPGHECLDCEDWDLWRALSFEQKSKLLTWRKLVSGRGADVNNQAHRDIFWFVMNNDLNAGTVPEEVFRSGDMFAKRNYSSPTTVAINAPSGPHTQSALF